MVLLIWPRIEVVLAEMYQHTARSRTGDVLETAGSPKYCAENMTQRVHVHLERPSLNLGPAMSWGDTFVHHVVSATCFLW